MHSKIDQKFKTLSNLKLIKKFFNHWSGCRARCSRKVSSISCVLRRTSQLNPCSMRDALRPQPTRRTSWKIVANPGWYPGFPTSFQLVRLVDCGFYRLQLLSQPVLVPVVGLHYDMWHVSQCFVQQCTYRCVYASEFHVAFCYCHKLFLYICYFYCISTIDVDGFTIW